MELFYTRLFYSYFIIKFLQIIFEFWEYERVTDEGFKGNKAACTLGDENCGWKLSVDLYCRRDASGITYCSGQCNTFDTCDDKVGDGEVVFVSADHICDHGCILLALLSEHQQCVAGIWLLYIYDGDYLRLDGVESNHLCKCADCNAFFDAEGFQHGVHSE